MGVVERDLADASLDALSTDRRFAIAYEAALRLATLTLYCNGYETYGAGHHRTTFQALKETMGDEGQGYADYFSRSAVASVQSLPTIEQERSQRQM